VSTSPRRSAWAKAARKRASVAAPRFTDRTS
jgi:hypothetical protein